MSISQVGVYCSVSFSIFFLQFFFFGYTFGSLVKRAMHQPPPCTFCRMRLYIIFFYPDALLTLITSIYCGEKYVLGWYASFLIKKVAMSGNKTTFFQIVFFVSYRSKVPWQWENRICVWSKSGCCCTRFVYYFSLPV